MRGVNNLNLTLCFMSFSLTGISSSEVRLKFPLLSVSRHDHQHVAYQVQFPPGSQSC